MSRDRKCSKRGCSSIAVSGERFCGYHLEEFEERTTITVTDLGHTEPTPATYIPRWKAQQQRQTMPVEARIAESARKFQEARQRGDREAMRRQVYYTRKLTSRHGIVVPEWASLGAEWSCSDAITAAAGLAAMAGLPLDAALELFRKSYADGLISNSGSVTAAARVAGIHRNTLMKMRSAS